MPRRRILAITYYAPPSQSPGSVRWLSMARCLRERGHEVTVLTTDAFGELEGDAPWVIRSHDLQASSTLRRIARRPAAVPGAAGTAVVAPAPTLVSSGIVPDNWALTWLPSVVRDARRVIRERAIDVVVTNGPPDSTYLAGLFLGRNRPAWIADFDDSWRFEPLRAPWPTALQDRLDARLEARVVRSADLVIGVTQPIADDFEQRFGVPTACIPLGWDPASAATPDEGDSAQLEPDTCSLAHFGSLTLPGRRDPTGLFEGLRRFAEREPQLAGRTRLVLVGAVSAAERELIDRQDPAVRGMIRELGGLPRAEAVALQRRADALVLLATGPYRSVSTTKLYEYLFANRPILALSTPNEATRIVGETGTGAVVDPDDPAAIAQAIADVAGGRLAEAYAPRGLEAYAQPGLAERFEAQIERAITLRARSR